MSKSPKPFNAVRKRIRIPIFDSDLYIVVSTSMEDGVNKLPKSLGAIYDVVDRNQAAIFFSNSPNYGIVFDKDSISTGIVHHEVAHLIRAMAHDIGYRIDPENDELIAYFEEWVNKRVHSVIGDLTSPN